MGKNHLFVLVGTTGVGKTHWSEIILKKFPNVKRVKNTTTRPRRPNDLTEENSYNFVTVDEFEVMVRGGKFLEHTVFRGHHYGSTLKAIQEVLENNHGIFALTPDGIKALWRYREMISIQPFFLVANNEILRDHLEKRGIHDVSEQDRLMAKATEFYMPSGVSYRKVFVTADDAINNAQIVSVIEDLIR